ncbi:metal ABC transporter solute-binding protein, Zn/Mn family [Crocosphaera sp. XPORK-15E]|uniref:metal ABC transporter solute-binding protein, Zn/Mn family n=1 Tax=Crocosphaera sp. XPORK-15E TaxID=3110247 RepID=UPI002B1F7824|nr:zinc ABC transporter substrate-binding protein [Crocosphaera sp. XPORK-15E]MEA5534828.1 zinc ABC transporter substrate-binding protein [Crocosphaera sp. XPORK-15E]
MNFPQIAVKLLQQKTFNLSTIILLGSIFVFIGITGCEVKKSQETGETAKPKVVSTSTIIADLVEQIAKKEVDHQGILKPGADPHVYEPVPSDSVAFEEADVIFYNGYNLEPGLIKLMNAAGIKAKKIAVGEAVKPLDFNYKGQKAPDPHVWGDAKNGIIMVNQIRDELIKISPEDESTFKQNAAILNANLQRLDSWIKQEITTIPDNKRNLVTTHDAFQYYTKAYGLTMTGTLIGISTEEQPSAQTVKNLAEVIKKTKVPAIFAETTINPTLIKTVAEEAGVKLAPKPLYSDSIGAPGTEGDSYIKMLVANTNSIVEALGGKAGEFKTN